MLRRIRSHHGFMVGYSRAVLESLAQPVLIYLTVLAGTLIVFFGAAFWLLEGRSNPAIETPLDALYFAVATMTTVGYGDITPATAAGKLASISGMLLGTALFVAYTAVLASAIIEVELIRDEEESEAAASGPGEGRGDDPAEGAGKDVGEATRSAGDARPRA